MLQTDSNGNSTISLFDSGKVSPETLAAGIIKIKRAFPKLPEGWYKEMDDALDRQNFTDERFKEAVHNIIDTCIYQAPAIAELLGYDKRVQVFTYRELQTKHKEAYFPNATYDPIYEEYLAIDVNGEQRFIKKFDFKNSNGRFKIWQEKKK